MDAFKSMTQHEFVHMIFRQYFRPFGGILAENFGKTEIHVFLHFHHLLTPADTLDRSCLSVIDYSRTSRPMQMS